MYVRPQGYRYPSGVRLPENYGGSAFSDAPSIEAEAEPAPTEEASATAEEKNDASSKETAALLPTSGFRLRLGSLFGKNSSIGTEELLIIALILLLSDSEGNDDLVLFLVLLFFIR